MMPADLRDPDVATLKLEYELAELAGGIEGMTFRRSYHTTFLSKPGTFIRFSPECPVCGLVSDEIQVPVPQALRGDSKVRQEAVEIGQRCVQCLSPLWIQGTVQAAIHASIRRARGHVTGFRFKLYTIGRIPTAEPWRSELA